MSWGLILTSMLPTGAPEERGSGWRSRSHGAPATAATNAPPSSTAKENAAPKGPLTGAQCRNIADLLFCGPFCAGTLQQAWAQHLMVPLAASGLSTGKRADHAGTSGQLGARSTDAGQAGSASESQVPDYQVISNSCTAAQGAPVEFAALLFCL